MKIKLCKTNQEFIDLYRGYLTEYELEMQLFIRNLANLNQELTKNDIRGGVYDGDELQIIFLNPYPFNLQLFSFADDCYEAYNFLCSYIVKNKIQLRGCQGDLVDCQQFISAYNDITGKLIGIYLSMDIMKLTKLKKNFEVKGSLSIATENERDIIHAGMSNFNYESLGEITDDDILELKITTLLEDKNLYCYRNPENKITSFVMARKVNNLHSYHIGAVYTFPAFRGQGYAKSMMYLICEKLIEEVDYLSLFVDKANPISNKIYRDIGFEVVIENFDCRLR